MAKKPSSNWRKANKQTKARYLISLSFAIEFFIIMMATIAVLIMLVENCQTWVEQQKAAYLVDPNSSWLSRHYDSFDDVILGSTAPTYYSLLTEKGVEGFSWFMLSTYNPYSLIPYIVIPLSAIGFLTSFGFAIMRHRALFPPKEKVKKQKGSKKGGK